MFHHIIFYMLAKLEKERSLLAPFYILQGKPSIQTIQDANLFELNRFFGLYKKINKQAYDAVVHDFLQEEWVLASGKSFALTSSGHAQYRHIQTQVEALHVNGKKWIGYDEQFYLRLLLLVQVWTNRLLNNSRYIPIVENKDVEEWTKQYYVKTRQHVDAYLHQLYKELVNLLQRMDDKTNELFISTFTNAHEIGATTQQLAEQFQLSKEDVDITIIHGLHYILNHVSSDNHPVLYELAQFKDVESRLTQSAQETHAFLQKGYQIAEIAYQRRLKENTIHDHIVEIALHATDFPYEQYVTEEIVGQIKDAIATLKTFKLKEIKTAVDKEITYFHIRLVLTMLRKEGDLA